VKEYQNLVSLMIAFENSFLNTWRNSIEEAKQG
jgi:hypothetical protein